MLESFPSSISPELKMCRATRMFVTDSAIEKLKAACGRLLSQNAKSMTLSALILMGFAVCRAYETPHTARDYFNELKAANNFTHYKDTFVCFSDDDNPGFAVISRGSDVIDEMKKAGGKPDKVMIQSKDLLFVETYYKGISNETQIYEPVGKDGTQWFDEFTSPMHGKIVYSINWVTGRYRMSIYALDRSKSVPAKEVFGKCELIHPPLQ